MNKAMQSAHIPQDPSAGISLNESLRAGEGPKASLGSCNACTDGLYRLGRNNEPLVTEVMLRNLTFRLCERCRAQLKAAL